MGRSTVQDHLPETPVVNLPKLTRPFVSVALPNYNGGSFLVEVIRSIVHQRYPHDCLEVCLVDNGSSDGSVEKVEEAFPSLIQSGWLKLIRLGENRGAPAAYNCGIRAMSRQAAYLLKMDNDLLLDPNCVAELVQLAQQEPSAGIVGGRVRYFQDKNRIHLLGSRISPWFGACRGIGKAASDRGKYNRVLQVQAVNGCLMLIKKAAIDRVGLMEEGYFLYFDDIDWSLKASQAGFQHSVSPTAIAYHNTALPTQRFSSTRWGYFNPHNTCLLAKRNFSPLGQLICWGVLSVKMLILSALVTVYNTHRQRRRAVLRAMWQGYHQGTALLLGIRSASVKNPSLEEILRG